MAKVIKDARGDRKITMEFNEDEAALIKVLLGKCNSVGTTARTWDLYEAFTEIALLPEVQVKAFGDGKFGLNITYKISRSGI